MSNIIYGHINLNGKPLEPETLANMKRALDFYSPDNSFTWKNNTAAFGCLMRFDTPESVNEKYPLTDPTGNIIFMAACRIDNRDELSNLLAIPYEQRAIITDGELMFHAYLKWGENACDRMLGDWSFLAYHQLENKLILGRDHCGITALYYTLLPDALVFSSSPKALLKLEFVPKKINELRIAQILTAWPGNGEDTCYEGIYNLLPGHYLKIENNTLQKIKFWELVEQDDLIFPNEQDYYDRFLDLFTQAVKARIRTTKNVGISLSGGLDSTSIAAIAAIELAKQNKELYAFTSVPLYKNYKAPKHRNGDEGELAGLMAKMYPNIRHYLVNAEGYDPIEAIKKGVEMFDEPMHAAANQYWIQAVNSKANNFNVGVLLNGQGGNGIISWPTKKERLRKDSTTIYYKRLFKFFFYLIFKKDNIKYPFLHFSHIDRSFLKNVNLVPQKQLTEYYSNFNNNYSFKESQIKFISQYINNTNSIYYRKSIWLGIDNVDCTASKNLIEFSCSIPDNIYVLNKYDKVLIKKGMKHLLPGPILSSKGKGFQGADIPIRIEKNQTEFSALLNLISKDSYIKKIIDTEKLSGSDSRMSISSVCRDFSIFFFTQIHFKN